MAVKIPVFVSCPTSLSKDQQQTYDEILKLLERENLERRALGKSDYPTDSPMKEIAIIARHCSGAMILGFSQAVVPLVRFRPWDDDPDGKLSKKNFKIPTLWNNLEAGLLFGMKLPLMVFREDGVEGGVFDNGVTDIFLQKLPVGGFGKDKTKVISAIQSWAGEVRRHYRNW